MQCRICNRQYRNVGAHVVKSHGMTCPEYRRMFGMKATKPLVDGDLSARFSRAARRRVANADYRQTLVEQCRENSRRNAEPLSDCPT